MKITIEKKNNKFYLEVEKPQYADWCNRHREADKIYRAIEKNIEKYKNEEEGYNVQYLNVKQMVNLLKNYFELNPNVLRIKVQYKRTYPSKWFRFKMKDSKGKTYSFWGEAFTEDFVKENIKVLKTKSLN